MTIEKAIERIKKDRNAQVEWAKHCFIQAPFTRNDYTDLAFKMGMGTNKALDILKEESDAPKEKCLLCEKHQNFISGLIKIIKDLIISGEPGRIQELKAAAYDITKGKNDNKG